MSNSLASPVAKDVVKSLVKDVAKDIAPTLDMVAIKKTIEEKLADDIVDCISLQVGSGGASHLHFLLRGKAATYVMKVFPREPFVISHDIETQQQLYNFFHDQGVMTPAVLCGGKQWLLLPLLGGVTDGWRVTKQPHNARGDDELARSLAQQLAIIHDSKISFQKKFPELCYDESHEAWQKKKREDIKKLFQDATPMDEKATATASGAIKILWDTLPQNVMLDMVACHGDFRTGNFLLQGGTGGQQLVGLLDWEMAGWGMSWEDIGWLAAPCWRYHQPQYHCGGLAELDVFLKHYLAHRTTLMNNITVADVMANHHWFQALAMIRWGLILSKQWHRKQHGLDILPELPQKEPNLIAIFTQAIGLLT